MEPNVERMFSLAGGNCLKNGLGQTVLVQAPLSYRLIFRYLSMGYRWTTDMAGHKEQVTPSAMTVVEGQPGTIRDGNLIYLNATAKLICQLDASRRQLDRLERHADRMLRSVGAA